MTRPSITWPILATSILIASLPLSSLREGGLILPSPTSDCDHLFAWHNEIVKVDSVNSSNTSNFHVTCNSSNPGGVLISTVMYVLVTQWRHQQQKVVCSSGWKAARCQGKSPQQSAPPGLCWSTLSTNCLVQYREFCICFCSFITKIFPPRILHLRALVLNMIRRSTSPFIDMTFYERHARQVHWVCFAARGSHSLSTDLTEHCNFSASLSSTIAKVSSKLANIHALHPIGLSRTCLDSSFQSFWVSKKIFLFLFLKQGKSARTRAHEQWVACSAFNRA